LPYFQRENDLPYVENAMLSLKAPHPFKLLHFAVSNQFNIPSSTTKVMKKAD
jgi:hypothetical protein